jgi:hypothetical protein
MTYLTVSQALGESRAAYANKAIAEAEIRKFAGTPTNQQFDIFLSHSFPDAEIILGVRAYLENDGFTTYVDWIDDPQSSRSKVTMETAAMLRARMAHCRFLLFATSETSPKSKWMPWELGYFDGKKPGKVGILPVVRTASDSFSGQEYLGLYPNFESITFDDYGTRIGTSVGPNKARLLEKLIRS